jgi:hypothetical protein
MSHSSRDLTPLPDLLHGAALGGPVRSRKPVYLDLLPPCNARCPAGENIQAWLAAPRAGEHERYGYLHAVEQATRAYSPGRTGC